MLQLQFSQPMEFRALFRPLWCEELMSAPDQAGRTQLLVHPSTANVDAFSVFHRLTCSYLVRVYSKNILNANFGLNAINILTSPPTRLPYDGSIPHTCAHCRKEVIEPGTRQISSPFLVTEYAFQAYGTKAIEAAADGCAFWQFFIRDFLDQDGRARRPDMYVPSQCSFTAWFYSKEKSRRERRREQYPVLLDTVHFSWSAKDDDGSETNQCHATFNVIADHGIIPTLGLYSQKLCLHSLDGPAYRYVEPRPGSVAVDSKTTLPKLAASFSHVRSHLKSAQNHRLNSDP